jgi:hypothetical protein
MPHDRTDYARLALACIRFVNGAGALAAPAAFARRVGIDADAQPGSLYAFRLFGVRTIVLGAELLSSDRATRERALRIGIVLHGVDAATAAVAGATRQLPARAAATAFAVSTANALLAGLALRAH